MEETNLLSIATTEINLSQLNSQRVKLNMAALLKEHSVKDFFGILVKGLLFNLKKDVTEKIDLENSQLSPKELKENNREGVLLEEILPYLLLLPQQFPVNSIPLSGANLTAMINDIKSSNNNLSQKIIALMNSQNFLMEYNQMINPSMPDALNLTAQAQRFNITAEALKDVSRAVSGYSYPFLKKSEDLFSQQAAVAETEAKVPEERIIVSFNRDPARITLENPNLNNDRLATVITLAEKILLKDTVPIGKAVDAGIDFPNNVSCRVNELAVSTLESTLTEGSLSFREVQGDESGILEIVTGSENNLFDLKLAQEIFSSRENPQVEMEGETNPIRQNELIEEIIQRITTQIKKNVQEAYLELKPEYLGRAFMKISLKDEHVCIEMVVSNNLVKEILENNLLTLRDSLREKGFVMDDFNVSVNPEAKGYYQQERGQLWQSKESFFAEPDSRLVLREFESQEGLDLVQSDYLWETGRINYLI